MRDLDNDDACMVVSKKGSSYAAASQLESRQDRLHRYSRISIPATPSPLSATAVLRAETTVSLLTQSSRTLDLRYNAPIKGVGVHVVRWVPAPSVASVARAVAVGAAYDPPVSDRDDGVAPNGDPYSKAASAASTLSIPPSIFSSVAVVRAPHITSLPPSQSNLRSSHRHQCISTSKSTPLQTRIAPCSSDATMNRQDADRSAITESSRHALMRADQHRRQTEFRDALRSRLLESASRQRKAFMDVLDHVEAEAIEKHAGHLTHARLDARKKTRKRSEAIPRALSNESLTLEDLPDQRTYSVYPQEKFHFHQQHFQDDKNAKCIPKILGPNQGNDLEKELRLCYRTGHLDEIKRKHFGKVYGATRRHYMDLERRVLLNDLRSKQSLREATATKQSGDKNKQTPMSSSSTLEKVFSAKSASKQVSKKSQRERNPNRHTDPVTISMRSYIPERYLERTSR
ncbi:hypothetical protein BASA50_000938 [Batrachochytrium salamandrivorans]|uniref:Uncharacterized protein n=1 Tax=Batrachochytrium salamandrivorans TaxID=1357716 RepID=A0ABQ8ESR5_9FUNG|nr:hypothetical protein BASA50_000938 [Batrachochytrium salamandrivorans]KAH9245613.1 hypothetical protein BASA81_016887 [Batrachochytrium salamandrivorans]